MPKDESTSPAEEPEDFSSAFAEFSGGKPPSDDLAPQQDAEPSGEEAPDDGKESAPDAEPQDASKDNEPEEKTDPWDGLPTFFRDKVKSLEDERERFRSDYLSAKGRLSKEVSQLARAKAALEAKLAEMESVRASPTPETPSEPDEDDPINLLKNDYPEIADPVAKLVESRVERRLAEERQRIEREISAKLDPVLAKQEDNFYESQYTALAQKMPYYDEVVDTEAWSEWLEGATDRTKALAGSPYADDVAAALTLFRSTEEGASVFNEVLSKHAEPTSARDAPGNGRDSEEVERVMKERKERLERAKIPPSKGGGTTHPPDADDFSSAFRVFSREAEKRGAAR